KALDVAKTAAKKIFNVLDFGAKGDGKTSDTESIRKALNAAGKVSGTVYFPAGVYPCHDLKVHEHTTLLAEPQWAYRGDGGAILSLDSTDASCVLDITGAFGAHIKGLFIRGIRNAPKQIHGIFLNNDKEYSKKEDSIVIDDCKVQYFSGHGLRLLRCWLFIVRHSYFSQNGGCGTLLTGWDGFVTDNQFSGNGSHGFGTETSGSTVMFTANRVEWNGGYGLYIADGDAWNVTGNCFDRNNGAGLCATNIQDTTVTGNVFRRCGANSAHLPEGERSCQVRIENCKGLTFTGNSCQAGRNDGGGGKLTPQVGIRIHKNAYTIISSNTMYQGFIDKPFDDLGQHGTDFVCVNNVFYPFN
ncbi:MAG: right-handed parallel beta-helix repeat-containing protein, partial [Tannerella sp.]|nr:right-handed parallel beta-helix repeat-containing protein [Tannerella sp.]